MRVAKTPMRHCHPAIGLGGGLRAGSLNVNQPTCSTPSLSSFTSTFTFSFNYDVRMPWYARLVLGKNIIWQDVLQADTSAKVKVFRRRRCWLPRLDG